MGIQKPNHCCSPGTTLPRATATALFVPRMLQIPATATKWGFYGAQKPYEVNRRGGGTKNATFFSCHGWGGAGAEEVRSPIKKNPHPHPNLAWVPQVWPQTRQILIGGSFPSSFASCSGFNFPNRHFFGCLCNFLCTTASKFYYISTKPSHIPVPLHTPTYPYIPVPPQAHA